MNENPTTPCAADGDAWFDRLVDGELSPAEYRRLVASLDDEPGAWRRCGLAFLEAQALRQELGEACGEAKPPLCAGTVVPSGPLVPVWQALVAIAGSIVLAYGLGFGSAGLFSPTTQEPLAGGNHSEQPDMVAAVPDQVAVNLPGNHNGLRPAGSVRLVVRDAADETTDVGELPVYEASQGMEQYLAERKPALPAELVEWLESRGVTVERQEQFLPIDLEDGRHMIVPVEGYRITPAAVVF